MESSGIPGNIQVTPQTYDLLSDSYIFTQREPVEVKGLGTMSTYILVGKRPEEGRS